MGELAGRGGTRGPQNVAPGARVARLSRPAARTDLCFLQPVLHLSKTTWFWQKIKFWCETEKTSDDVTGDVLATRG